MIGQALQRSRLMMPSYSFWQLWRIFLTTIPYIELLHNHPITRNSSRQSRNSIESRDTKFTGETLFTNQSSNHCTMSTSLRSLYSAIQYMQGSVMGPIYIFGLGLHAPNPKFLNKNNAIMEKISAVCVTQVEPILTQ